MGVIFKGSGFYVNDAKKSSSTSKPLADKAVKPGNKESKGDKGSSKSQSA